MADVASSFDALDEVDAKKVVLCRDRDTGLRAVIAIHSTRLGPAAGGLRFKPYNDHAEAIRDAVRLAEAMTCKYAAAGLALGGAKAVIIGDPVTEKSDELLRRFGRFVQEQGGEYSAGEDVGTNGRDMQVLAEETEWLVSLPAESGGPGDVSQTTARGVWQAIRACVKHSRGEATLDGVSVAVQGLGQVGAKLARLLAQDGAQLVLADIDQRRVEELAAELDAKTVPPDAIATADVDVLAPCALGDAVNRDNVNDIRALIVAGAANNVFSDAGVADALQGRGVLYAVDYIANAGGIVYDDFMLQRPRPVRFDHDLALERVDRIYERTLETLTRAASEGRPIREAARLMVDERLTAGAQARRLADGQEVFRAVRREA